MAERTMLEALIIILITLVFVGVVVTLVYHPEGGLLGKVAKLALSVEKYVPFIPTKEVTQDKKIPDGVAEAQHNFIEAIKDSKSKQNQFCLVEFSLSGMEKYEMQLTNYEEGNSKEINSRIIKEEKYGEVFLNEVNVKNAQFCTLNAKIFYDCYLAKTPKKDCSESISYYLPIVWVKDGKITFSGTSYALAPYMVKIKEGNIDKFCFIPLHSFGAFGCDAKEETIDNDCLPKIKKAIPLC